MLKFIKKIFITTKALLTQRNLQPSSLFERIGDWFVAPLSHILRTNHFNMIKDDKDRFFYTRAVETPGINNAIKYIVFTLTTALFSPFALIGLPFKLLGLSSAKMRNIYFNWEQPAKLEFPIIAFEKPEDIQSAKVWNNESIIKSAIENKKAYLLLDHIIKNPKQWFIHYIQLLGHLENNSLTPHIHECVCAVGKNFNRHICNRRQEIEQTLVKDLQDFKKKSNSISYLSLGAAGLLQELINIYYLASQGFTSMQLVLVDPSFKHRSHGKLDLFTQFVNAISRERHIQIDLKFLNKIQDVPSEETFDVISVIDFEKIKITKLTENTFQACPDICETYSHLKKDGRFYLSYSGTDLIYNDKKCLYKNYDSGEELLVTKVVDKHSELSLEKKEFITEIKIDIEQLRADPLIYSNQIPQAIFHKPTDKLLEPIVPNVNDLSLNLNNTLNAFI